MPVNPITTPLPADLPENWVNTQTIAAEGTDVGLSEQHGYNYLMEQVNAAQQGVNTLGNAFESLTPGEVGVTAKRTYTCVIGTSQNGWTAADCDYLCDGTNDGIIVNTAIANLKQVSGIKTIKFLPGTYKFDRALSPFPGWTSLVGTDNRGVTFQWDASNWADGTNGFLVQMDRYSSIYGIEFTASKINTSTYFYPTILYYMYVDVPLQVKNCRFYASSNMGRVIQGAYSAWINFENCEFEGSYNTVVQCEFDFRYATPSFINCVFKLSGSSSDKCIDNFTTGKIIGCHFSGTLGGAVIEATSPTQNVLLLGNTFNCNCPDTINFSVGNQRGTNIQVIGNNFANTNTTFINFMSSAVSMTKVVFSENIVRNNSTISHVVQFANVSSVIASNNILNRTNGDAAWCQFNLQNVQFAMITNNLMDLAPVQVNVTESMVDNNIILNAGETS